MISVEEALARILALCTPVATEAVPLAEAFGRVLRMPVVARWDQPPFAASAMDGYAVAEEPLPGARLVVVGEAAAGRPWRGQLKPGESVRLFTGAPIPEGARFVVIQEQTRREGNFIILADRLEREPYIRPAGLDFRRGERLEAPCRLGPAEVALAAAMGAQDVVVARRPEVALIATGDELVPPGTAPGPGQIVASSILGLAALVAEEGARPLILPIARDEPTQLRVVLEQAQGAELIVTTGGASVGEHDLVQPVAAALGAELALWKVAVRPGKPMMAGRLFGVPFLGLPGNPVSALVSAHLFLRPALRALLGLQAMPLLTREAILAEALPPNGPRAHYMRAVFDADGRIRALPNQDSSLLSVLAKADALLVRPPHDPARAAGAVVAYLPLRQH